MAKIDPIIHDTDPIQKPLEEQIVRFVVGVKCNLCGSEIIIASYRKDNGCPGCNRKVMGARIRLEVDYAPPVPIVLTSR